FYDPQSELRRVLTLLNISATDRVMWKACSTISSTLRHSWITTQELTLSRFPTDVLDCYTKMCAEAGDIYEASADKVRSLAEGKNGSPDFPLTKDGLRPVFVLQNLNRACHSPRTTPIDGPPPLPAVEEQPDVGFVACIEDGVLEAQALLLFDSIRRYT